MIRVIALEPAETAGVSKSFEERVTNFEKACNAFEAEVVGLDLMAGCNIMGTPDGLVAVFNVVRVRGGQPMPVSAADFEKAKRLAGRAGL